MDQTQLDEERNEWLQSLKAIIKKEGKERAAELLHALKSYAESHGVTVPFSANTPYINTIHVKDQPAMAGDGHLEWRIRSLVRWNAMAMVVRANRTSDGIGGHISTYASAAMLYEIGFNHFFRGADAGLDRDLLYIQGHASPGIYARAFLEGRLSTEQLENFRRELAPNGGLSSYPHPWLMPDFWEFPTVSMGLGPLMAIYQARFMRYLEDRGLKPKSSAKVWAFLGDGETDEPESLGAIGLAAREKLDNLIFVINCNLQRLDGPVRGNGKIIQELEANFRGAGWNVIKVVWGSDWDPLLKEDDEGWLVKRMSEAVDGEYQKYVVETGAYIREKFFGKYPQVEKLVEKLSDEKLKSLRRGGHDPEKVYAAYKKAVEHTGGPTVILAKTIKGYGLGESGEGKNISHQQKKLNEDELREFRSRYGIPISDEDVAKAPFYKPADNTPEMKYLKERRAALGGGVPQRKFAPTPITLSKADLFDEFFTGTQEREVSTTMVFVRILAKLLRDPAVAKLIVPIVPDEARTFGMEALFKQCGIYSHVGQNYEPVDKASLLYYREAVDGQILEEGITEAGSMSSFIAAGTSGASYGITTIPFFIYYSMFGFQRIGDLVWAAGDMRCRGFMLGATAGRTTLAGEGLQHQDGQSLLLAHPVPNLMVYDPCFAFELAVIIQDGMRRMYENNEEIFYYIAVMNENYAMPPMTEGSKDNILKGMYVFKDDPKAQVDLIGSGSILREVIKAATILADDFGVTSKILSLTSVKELYKEAIATERAQKMDTSKKGLPFVTQILGGSAAIAVVATDYVRAVPDMLARFCPKPFYTLGTDGFGRSEAREELRDYFEVDAKSIAYTALYGLWKQGLYSEKHLKEAMKKLGIDPNKKNSLNT